MNERNEYEVPEGYLYTKDHEWVKSKSDGNVLVGITDYAAKMLNDIVYVTLPQEGRALSRKEVLGQVESVKTVSDIFMPVSGIILKTNQSLTKLPEAVSDSPYEKGWLLEVKPESYDTESSDLLDAKSYREYIQNLEKEEH